MYGAQTLAGLQLMRIEQCAAVSAASSGEPGQGAFGLVDSDTRIAVPGGDLALCQGQMPAAKAID